VVRHRKPLLKLVVRSGQDGLGGSAACDWQITLGPSPKASYVIAEELFLNQDPHEVGH
jgi:hypothetical protein